MEVEPVLRDMTEKGGFRDVTELPHAEEFFRFYHRVPVDERTAMEDHINELLAKCALEPSNRWGSILNTSIEGGRTSPETGIRGDWTGTPYSPLWDACGQNDELAARVFGNLWKLMIIRRSEHWVGIRSDPTFPNRGITLQGKTYFISPEE